MVGVDGQAVVLRILYTLAFPIVDHCTHSITSCVRCFLLPDHSSTKARHAREQRGRQKTSCLARHLVLFSRPFHRLLRSGRRVSVYPAPCARRGIRFRHGSMVLQPEFSGELLALSLRLLYACQAAPFRRVVISRIHHPTSCPLA